MLKKTIIKKIIFVLVCILVLFVVFFKNNYIILNEKIEKIEYPQKGMVNNEEMAIKLGYIYLNGLRNFDLDIVKEDDLIAEYDDNLKAWVVRTKSIEIQDAKVIDESVIIAIRKKDAKVMYFSLYH